MVSIFTSSVSFKILRKTFSRSLFDLKSIFSVFHFKLLGIYRDKINLSFKISALACRLEDVCSAPGRIPTTARSIWGSDIMEFFKRVFYRYVITTAMTPLILFLFLEPNHVDEQKWPTCFAVLFQRACNLTRVLS